PVFSFAPIAVSDVVIKETIVNELGQIELLLQLLVTGHGGETANIEKGSERLHRPVFSLELIDNVVLLLFAAEIGGSKGGVRTLGGVVNSPVQAIEVEVNITIVTHHPAHLSK